MSKYFDDAKPVKEHLLRSGGLGGEIRDLRKDLAGAFTLVQQDVEAGSRLLIEFSFDGSAPPAPGSNTDKAGLCHTSGGSYVAGTKMVDRLGEVYDYKGLFGMAWVELGRWLKKKWVNPWQSSDAMFCSELVAQVLKDSNYPGAEQFDPGSTDPEQLLRFFEGEEARS